MSALAYRRSSISNRAAFHAETLIVEPPGGRRLLGLCTTLAWVCSFIVIFLLTGGCSDFKPIDYSRVKLGETTREEVVAMVGAPGSVGQFILQVATLEFDARGGVLPSGKFDTPTNRAQVSPNIFVPVTKNGKVEVDRYTGPGLFSVKSMTVDYYDNKLLGYFYMNGLSQEYPIDPAKSAQIQIGKTSETELLALIGPPQSARLTTAHGLETKAFMWLPLPSALFVHLDTDGMVDVVIELQSGVGTLKTASGTKRITS